MNFVAKFAFSGLLVSSFLYAQAPSEPPASAATSGTISAGDMSIKPVPSDSDTSNDADIVADPASLIPDLPPVPHAKATLIGGTVERALHPIVF